MQRDGGPGAGGPGAGGNPTGGSFTGPAETLEIIGNHCYAYSGSFPATTSPVTRLSFTSGNFYVVGEIRLCGMLHTTTPPNGRIAVMTVTLNGQTVILSKVDNEAEDMPPADIAPIIIPPYTEVEVTIDNDDDDADYIGTVSVTGRIYRG